MSDLSDDELEGIVDEREEQGGIQYVNELGEPEEPMKERATVAQHETVITPPPVAAPPEVPPAPADDDTPPDPGFQILPRKGRPPSVYYNGIAVGIWIHENFYSDTGAEIEQRLTLMGLDPGLAKWYGKQRDARIAADMELAQDPAYQGFARAEEQHSVSTSAMREAFLEAQRKKGGS